MKSWKRTAAAPSDPGLVTLRLPPGKFGASIGRSSSGTCVVARVKDDGASASLLKVGDAIVSLNGVELASMDDAGVKAWAAHARSLAGGPKTAVVRRRAPPESSAASPPPSGKSAWNWTRSGRRGRVAGPRSVEEVEAAQLALAGRGEYPNLFDEAMPMIWLSSLVYTFANIVEEARSDDSSLEIPREIMDKYKDRRLDVRKLNGGRGLSLNQIHDQFAGQAEELERLGLIAPHDLTFVERLKEIEGESRKDKLFMEVFDSLNSERECVYGVFKDKLNKRIIIAFRGSSNMNDWRMNLRSQLIGMRTPGLLASKLSGRLSDEVRVHRGFYQYLFDNDRQEGDQVYDKIVRDIRPFVGDGYRIYVTGHSLGAALSTLLAFKLAGSADEWVPKPVSLINYASPFVGGTGFRTAFRRLERDGLIRFLRITNSKDVVPTIPPVATSVVNGGRMKHNGIHLRFNEGGDYDIAYPKRDNWLGRTLGNTIVKPFWAVGSYHGFPLVDERMNLHHEELSNMMINSLYANKSIVGSEFLSESNSSEKIEED